MEDKIICPECNTGVITLTEEKYCCSNCDYSTLLNERKRKDDLKFILDEVDRSNKRMLR